MLDREKLRQAFEDPAEFTTSPLYPAEDPPDPDPRPGPAPPGRRG